MGRGGSFGSGQFCAEKTKRLINARAERRFLDRADNVSADISTINTRTGRSPFSEYTLYREPNDDNVARAIVVSADELVSSVRARGQFIVFFLFLRESR